MRLTTGALVLAVTASCGVSGCVAAAAAGAVAGAGTYAYVKGDLNATVQASLDDAWAATREAVRELGLKVTEEAKDEFGARLVALQAKGGDVKIRLEPEGAEATKINIRVGTFGDEKKSRLILSRIEENL